MLNNREQVQHTIEGLPVDRVPLGELVVDPAFCLKALRCQRFSFPVAREFWQRFNLDLVVLPPPQEGFGSLEAENMDKDSWSLERWRKETDYYIFSLVNGGFSRALASMGFRSFMEATVREPDRVKQSIRSFFVQALEEVEAAALAGGDGIIIGDDLAYQKGTYISPAALRQQYFPFLQEFLEQAREQGLTVFFHSDGNLEEILADLVQTGVHGLQGLEPAAGMDLNNIREMYGHKVCLMGNLDLACLQDGVEEEAVKAGVARVMEAGKPGRRFIFGTCSGLHESLSVEKVELMYQEALRQGKYL